MPSAVAPSVSTTVRITPTRSAMTPQANLPTAPPANTSASAVPTPATVRPLAISAKGRKVSRPVRVALSIMPTAESAWKPRASLMPQPRWARAASRAASSAAAPVPSRTRIARIATAAASPRTP